MTAGDKKLLLDAWKEVVDVQMHFNDLELRIRSFAFTVTAAFLALGGYALKDAGPVSLHFIHIPLAAIVVFSAVIPVGAFYFMERLWYHPLLMGAVAEGTNLEAMLRTADIPIDLGGNISRASGIENWIFGQKKEFSQEDIDARPTLSGHKTEAIPNSAKLFVKAGPWAVFTRRSFRSSHKMASFYGLLALSLVALGAALWLADRPAQSEPGPSQTHVVLNVRTSVGH